MCCRASSQRGEVGISTGLNPALELVNSTGLSGIIREMLLERHHRMPGCFVGSMDGPGRASSSNISFKILSQAVRCAFG